MNTGIHNTCEIGPLKKVLLHRPGKELENLMPEHLDRLLFDDIPFLQAAQQEHDAFAECLRQAGAEVIYLTDLVAETMELSGQRSELLETFLDEAEIDDHRLRDILLDFFSSLDNKTLVEQMTAGVRKDELRGFESGRLSDYLSLSKGDYPFLIDPMPNLYFTRDPFATLGSGVSIHKMHTLTRNRETLFGKFIFQYHPLYQNAPKWYDRGERSSLEGGDILVLSPQVVAVGISQRTQEDSIDKFAKTVLSLSKTFKKILAFDIPKSRSFMHLDTVFTMVDRDKFTVHPQILQTLTVFVMTLGENGEVLIRQEEGSLENILKEHLQLDHVTLIRCGSDNIIDAAREQWSDGSNTLAIAPGEVVVYRRNQVTNRALEEHGIKLHIIPCSELSRGRGGPRCMSMPLWREDI